MKWECLIIIIIINGLLKELGSQKAENIQLHIWGMGYELQIIYK